MRELGVGIVGAGTIAHAHAAALRAAGAEVVGVMSRKLADAERLARATGASLATDSLDQLLAEPSVRLVDICSPSEHHAAATIAAARAGRHVHVEKPMALTLADADRMVDACQAAGVSLMVGQTARFQSVSRALQAAVSAGDVGRPFHLEVVWDHGTFWPGGWRAWQLDPARSGGHLVHNGVHAFDLACWLLGETPTRVTAVGRAVAAADLPVHDYWHALLEFSAGATAVCEIGYVLRPAGAVERTVSLYGTRGTASSSSRADGVVYAEGGVQSPLVNGPEALRVQLAAWLQSVRTNAPPPVSGADGRRALAIALAAQRSADTGQPQAIDA